MGMMMAESLDALEREFTSDDGFFFNLHFRKFDPEAAVRVKPLIERLDLTTADHRTNYRLLWLLWQVYIELEIAQAHSVGGTELTQLSQLLFPEFARIFDAGLGAIVKKSE